jgi:hypothetical protein
VYEFGPWEGSPLHRELQAKLDEHKRKRHESLNREQRKVVDDFLVLVSRHEPNRFLREEAERALSRQGSAVSPSISDKRS